MGMIILGMIATVLVCAQTFGAFLGMGWGLVHGAGPAAILALVPVALGVALIWGGYFYVVRRDWTYRSGAFALYAVSIVALNESLLPSTPLQAWRSRRAMERLQITNVRDAVARSPSGTPIGIQVTYEVRFPVDTVCLISTAGMTPIEGQERHPWLQFDFGFQTIDPEPASVQLSSYRFRGQTTYTVTAIRLPNFLSYNQQASTACIHDVVRPGFTEPDFFDTLSRRTRVRYHTELVLTSPDVSESLILNRYDTQREYDLEDLYRKSKDAGAERCSR
jgi:hypothetical protein